MLPRAGGHVIFGITPSRRLPISPSPNFRQNHYLSERIHSDFSDFSGREGEDESESWPFRTRHVAFLFSSLPPPFFLLPPCTTTGHYCHCAYTSASTSNQRPTPPHSQLPSRRPQHQHAREPTSNFLAGYPVTRSASSGRSSSSSLSFFFIVRFLYARRSTAPQGLDDDPIPIIIWNALQWPIQAQTLD